MNMKPKAEILKDIKRIKGNIRRCESYISKKPEDIDAIAIMDTTKKLLDSKIADLNQLNK